MSESEFQLLHIISSYKFGRLGEACEEKTEKKKQKLSKCYAISQAKQNKQIGNNQINDNCDFVVKIQTENTKRWQQMQNWRSVNNSGKCEFEQMLSDDVNYHLFTSSEQNRKCESISLKYTKGPIVLLIFFTARRNLISKCLS